MKTAAHYVDRPAPLVAVAVEKLACGAAERDWWRAVAAYGPDHPALVSTRDFAAIIDRQPQTIRLWRMLGRGPMPVKVRGRLRYVRRDAIAWWTLHRRWRRVRGTA